MTQRFTYQLEINNKLEGSKIIVSNLLELSITYVKVEDRLCPSSRPDSTFTGMCFWEGDLKIILDVNGNLVILNDHDRRWKQKTTISIEEVGSYTFQGISLKSDKSGFYLIFSITKGEFIPPRLIQSYKVGEPITLYLPVDKENGMKWILSLSRGLELIHEKEEEDCKKLINCNYKKIFIFRGIKSGKESVIARYAYPNHQFEALPKIIRYDIR